MHKASLFIVLWLMLCPVETVANGMDAYWADLNAITPALLDHSFVPLNRVPKCPTSDICGLVSSSINMSDIEKRRFTFVRPLIVTNSGSEFLNALKKTTACQNLGVLSLVRPINGDGTDPDSERYDFIRPTYGYAIYEITTSFGKDYLIRAEGYADSGVEADNRSSLDNYSQPTRPLASEPTVENPLAGVFIDVKSMDCRVYGQRVAFSKSIVYEKPTDIQKEIDNQTWFVSPIEFRNHLFVLNAYQLDISSPGQAAHRIILNISERLASGWSTTFSLISN